MDVIKTRLQAPNSPYKGFADCVKRTISEDGYVCLVIYLSMYFIYIYYFGHLSIYLFIYYQSLYYLCFGYYAPVPSNTKQSLSC